MSNDSVRDITTISVPTTLVAAVLGALWALFSQSRSC